MDDKCFFLEWIIKENLDSKILVFVCIKVCVEWVFKVMEWVGIKALIIYSDKD